MNKRYFFILLCRRSKAKRVKFKIR